MRPTAIRPDHFPWFDYANYSFSLGLDLGGRAFLSGHTASEHDPESGRIVIRGDMTDQARVSWAKIGTILEAAGLDRDDVVRVVEYVTKDGIEHYAQAEAVRAEVLGSVTPAVNTVVVNQLLRPTALMEVEVTAARNGTAYTVGSNGRAAYAPAVAAEGVVYLSTVHPYDADGNLVGRGDVEAQTRQIFRNASAILEGIGLSMANVTKTLDMVRPEALGQYKHTGRVRKEFLGPVYPGAAGIIQPRVAADDDVLISYDFMASVHEAEVINPGWSRYAKLTYSPAVRAGNTVFMSGQAALDPESEQAVHPGDIAAQAEYTLRNIVATLEAGGLGPEHLVKTVEYVTPEGLVDYRSTAGVRKKVLVEPFPPSTGIICHSLLRPEFMIEIDPMAVVWEPS